MFNRKTLRNILFIFVLLQGFNLLLAGVQVAINSSYQPSSWQYLLALTGSTVFAGLLLIKITNKRELMELLFEAQPGNKEG